MTNFLNHITTGPSADGQRIVIVAVEGAGKTTLAANAPRALLVRLEDGAGSVATPKTPVITTWTDFIGLLDELRLSAISNRLPFKTISFDSATAVERLIHDHVIASDEAVAKAAQQKVLLKPTPNMETVHGAYGKGYAIATNYFANFLYRCDEFARNAKINIVITCHTFPSLVRDAAYGEYNSWDLLLHSPKNDKNYGKRELLTQWADIIGFLHEPLFVSKSDSGQMLRGISANQGRQLAIERTPGWVAKNRYGLTGLIPIPKLNGWNNLANAVWNSCGVDIWNRDV